jgi:hypothetical protein
VGKLDIDRRRAVLDALIDRMIDGPLLMSSHTSHLTCATH